MTKPVKAAGVTRSEFWGCLFSLGAALLVVALCVAVLVGFVWVVSWAWHAGARP